MFKNVYWVPFLSSWSFLDITYDYYQNKNMWNVLIIIRNIKILDNNNCKITDLYISSLDINERFVGKTLYNLLFQL